MDLATPALAAAAVHVMIPFFKKLAEGTAGELGKKIANAPGELFDFVKEKFAGDPDATQALERAQAQPDDAEAVSHLETALAASLDSDDAFSQRVRTLIGSAGLGGVHNSFTTTITGDGNKTANFGTVNGDVSF